MLHASQLFLRRTSYVVKTFRSSGSGVDPPQVYSTTQAAYTGSAAETPVDTSLPPAHVMARRTVDHAVRRQRIHAPPTARVTAAQGAKDFTM